MEALVQRWGAPVLLVLLLIGWADLVGRNRAYNPCVEADGVGIMAQAWGKTLIRCHDGTEHWVRR